MAAVTRFAPSPTGYIHIGNVRSAIYPYLLAKQTGGKLILRIEDTDRARFVPGATEKIMETLDWLGLTWDEGPVLADLKPGEIYQDPAREMQTAGPHGPYFQSIRKEIYHQWAQKLIAAGRAYADPTPPEQIAQYREECSKNKTAFLYRNYRPENPPEWHEGLPLRFKADPQPRAWHDAVMGDLSAGPEVQDDIILIKADGLPTYNFAHIVDDAEMGVTHVIRGVEYLSSMPNYLALYEALGLERPVFVSLPHILGTNSNKKLSKRDGAKSVTDYRDAGVLPEAMLNYLACLGWNDGTEQEIYTREELLEHFSLDRIQSSGAHFDETKLFWLNGQWLRRLVEAQGSEAFLPRTAGFWPDAAASASAEYRAQVFAIIYDRLKTLSDLREMTGYFFTEPAVNLELLRSNKFLRKMPEARWKELLQMTIDRLEAQESWSADRLQETMNALLATSGEKPAQYFSLIRLAISFAPFSPALHLTLAVLGRDRTLSRLRTLLQAL